jgi:hypothetical protein
MRGDIGPLGRRPAWSFRRVSRANALAVAFGGMLFRVGARVRFVPRMGEGNCGIDRPSGYSWLTLPWLRSRLDSLTTASGFGARLFYIRRSPAALKRHAGRELALRAGALLLLPLQKFAKQHLALLLGKIRGRRTFILQKCGKIAASHLWIHRILWTNTT